MKTDTIAAIATGLTDSGIGIVRISGPDAFKVIRKLFRKKNGAAADLSRSHTVQYGYLYEDENEDSEKLDEVLIVIMKGPHSYTGEDTAEIDCHGGILMMRKILETVLRHGARAAEPGEFTKRAFLNGRIDLSQAEAVIDVIRAKNDLAMKNSMRQLNGRESAKIRKLRENILYEIAYIESALDDPEHISLDGYREKLNANLESILVQVDKLIDSADYGRMISEGIRTVIVGKPNAGKSSLMNVLLGEDRAIVTEIAGTTRDTLEEQVRFGDISLQITDTAGIRDTKDVIEKIGVDRAKHAASDADLILYVIDSSVSLDENDSEILRMISGRKAIILFNKSDLPAALDVDRMKTDERFAGHPVITISARDESGMDELKDTIRNLFDRGDVCTNDEVLITNLRHKESLVGARQSLRMVMESIKNGLPEDFFSIDLTDAYAQLGSIIGEAVEDDVINEIFSRFCMGK